MQFLGKALSLPVYKHLQYKVLHGLMLAWLTTTFQFREDLLLETLLFLRLVSVRRDELYIFAVHKAMNTRISIPEREEFSSKPLAVTC